MMQLAANLVRLNSKRDSHPLLTLLFGIKLLVAIPCELS
jgi:hypothetical protein